MTASGQSPAMVFLHRAALLAGILAIIAGVFGMHLMTGSHSMPMAAARADAAMLQVPEAAAGHSGHARDGAAAPETSETAVTASLSGGACVEPGGCAGMSAMDAICIPSVGNAPLAAPAPGMTAFAVQGVGAAIVATSRYAYLPLSPSPGELSISRT